MHLGDKAIVAGDAVAFDDFGNLLHDLRDAGELAERRLDADIGADSESELSRIERDGEAGDDADVLQPLQPLADALRRDGERPREVGERGARIRLEQCDQPRVPVVEIRASVSPVILQVSHPKSAAD